MAFSLVIPCKGRGTWFVFFCAALISLVSFQIRGQGIGFNHVTGTANISIPLYEVGSVPVSLTYSASGIQVRQVAGPVGLGWQLRAGGQISREVKGLPDDALGLGWIYNGAKEQIDNFTLPSGDDCEASESQDEHTQVESLYTLPDTEPDIFRINTPFVSGSFVLVVDGNLLQGGTVSAVQIGGYQDLLISLKIVEDIESFTLTDEMGVVYEFDVVDQSTRYVDFEKNAAYFKNMQTHRYLSRSNTTWNLSKIIYPNGQHVAFDYSTVGRAIDSGFTQLLQRSYQEGLAKNYRFKGSSVGYFGIVSIPNTINTLKSISSSEGEKVEFLFSTRNDEISENRLVKVEMYRYGQLLSAYELNYADVYPSFFEGQELSVKTKEYEKRTFLKSVLPRYGDKVYQGYSFDYHGVYDLYSKLPSHASTWVDIYGYYKKNNSSTVSGRLYYYPESEFLEEAVYSEEAFSDSHPAKPTEVVIVREMIPSLYYNPALDQANQYRYEPLPASHPNKGTEVEVTEFDRSVDPDGLHYGSLSKVTYPTGGNTRLFYEANTYHDPVAQSSYYGPGIRLKQTIVHDGVSNKNNIITDYDYQKISPTHGVGKLIERPAFAFGATYRTYSVDPKIGYGGMADTIPALSYEDIGSGFTDQQKAEMLSVRTNFDMSSGQSRVYYERVAVSNPGKGRTVYNFDVTATIDEQSANGGDWQATQAHLAGECTGGKDYQVGRFSTGYNVYPFPSNPNYHFQRGLLSSVEIYHENGKKLSQLEYTYTRVQPESGTAVFGFVAEAIPTYLPSIGVPPHAHLTLNFYVYAKYMLFTEVRNSIQRVKQTLFDPNDSDKKIVTETISSYDGTHGRKNTSLTINSDGSIVRSYKKYVADYAISSPQDAASEALEILQSLHQTGRAVEYHSTVKHPDNSEKLISASLTTFKDFGNGVINPHKQYALGTTKVASSFSPSTVSDGGFEQDVDYELVQQNLGYDSNHKILTSVNEKSQMTSGLHWGDQSRKVIANIQNGAADHFLYDGFEEGTEYGFQIDQATLMSGLARTGKRFVKLEGLMDFLSGNMIKADHTESFVLSLWISSIGEAQVTYDITNVDGTSSFGNGYIDIESPLGWTYHEKEIDASTLPADFVIKITSDSEVFIDDVLLYPSEASITYRSFGEKGELLSESAAGKTSAYFEYDDQLRNTLVLDNDRNILSKNEYSDVEVEVPLHYDFVYRGLNRLNMVVFELRHPELVADDEFFWDFGDGTDWVQMIPGQKTIGHLYAEEGYYSVKLRVGDVTSSVISSQTVFVQIESGVKLCAEGSKTVDLCSLAAVETFAEGYCTGYSHDFRTKFSIKSIDSYDESTISYSWQRSFEDSPDNWEVVGNQSTLDWLENSSYNIKCIIYFGSSILISDVKSVKVVKNGLCSDLPLDQY
ncbi:hypothetical protein SAMN04488029_0648 [Reichenbachiella faecimaris]|uniref:PKD domain-containing protein n=1 Tax=Reichenbachiella faecimaris TaxID=692418 RepID=A0A1W2G6L2_REIFA|nr:PKD domain-containing protein [Reichenbachiella faecimaris]SMD32305.1 hypothetical protein SAMN04488029_0648 [Reichenbachiella faecimaris]